MEYCAYCGSPVDKVSFAPCPRCGKPSNGAPPPVPGSGGSNTALIVIIAVVVVLLLVAVLGIVAAIAIPNFVTATQRAKQRRTMADIRSLATAAEAYASDNNEYPQTVDPLVPKYIKAIPSTDGWGHAIEYSCVKDETGKCTGYEIASPGKDGLRESEPSHGGTANFDCDIVYSNGTFREYPEGVQR